MNDNWIKLNRKILDSDVFKNEKLLKIWIWLILKANFQDNTFLLGRQQITVKRGQCVIGLIKASEVLNISKNTIAYWIDYLEKIGKVGLKKTNKYTIITIKKYEEYQSYGLKWDSNGTQKGTQMGTNKNVKNVKNVKNEKKYICELNSQSEFNSQDYIKGMLTDKNKHIQIIGKYYISTKAHFPSKKAIQDDIKRWARDAKTISEYPEERINSTYLYVSNKFPEVWNLSTIKKYISKASFKVESRFLDITNI